MNTSKSPYRGLRYYGYLGLLVILASEVLLFFGVEPIPSFFTPIVWSGYILFIDSLIQKLQGRSLVSDRAGWFLLLLLLSIVFWLVFEFYNHFIKNWTYQGLPENPLVRGFGYIWSFATILPAILLTARLVEVMGLRHVTVHKVRVGPATRWTLMVLGALFLLVPLLVPFSIARYLIAFVWLGFVFLLDPINQVRGGWSLLNDWEHGDISRLLALFASGLICGLFWEFWNYWAATKWVYNVPIPLGPKMFEMPLGGYLGFLPFAVECHVMTAFVLTFRREKWFPGREI